MNTSTGRYDTIAQDRVIWGQAAADAVVAEADTRGAESVFIVASRTLNQATDVVSNIGRALGPRLAGVFDGCREHTPRESVMAAAEAVRAARPDLICAVGGGTVIDTVKVLLVALAAGVQSAAALDDWHVSADENGQRVLPDVPDPPMRQIAVPTTLSGAEYSCLGGATDSRRRVKHAFYGARIGPASVILDAAATLPTPDWLWLSTGIRAVDHAVESLCSKTPVPLVDACALHALTLLGEALPRNRQQPDDLAARQQAMHGAWLASQGILRVDYGASHGLGHALGAATGMSHGHTSCVLLPAVLRFNAEDPALREPQHRVAEALGDTADDAAGAVERLVAALGLPTRLRDLDVSRDVFDTIAAAAMDNIWVKTNPRPLTREADVRDILESAY